MTIAGIVLAAGQSRRFGDDDKLLAPLDGEPLAARAARVMADADVDLRIVVTTSEAVADLFDGFEALVIQDETEQSESLVHGVKRAMGADVDRIVVTLADMPRVTADMINRVAGMPGAACVTDGTRRMPPAAFPAEMFDALLSIEGDRGAGPLLQKIQKGGLLEVDPDLLVDVDRPEDLAALQKNA